MKIVLAVIAAVLVVVSKAVTNPTCGYFVMKSTNPNNPGWDGHPMGTTGANANGQCGSYQQQADGSHINGNGYYCMGTTGNYSIHKVEGCNDMYCNNGTNCDSDMMVPTSQYDAANFVCAAACKPASGNFFLFLEQYVEQDGGCTTNFTFNSALIDICFKNDDDLYQFDSCITGDNSDDSSDDGDDNEIIWTSKYYTDDACTAESTTSTSTTSTSSTTSTTTSSTTSTTTSSTTSTTTSSTTSTTTSSTTSTTPSSTTSTTTTSTTSTTGTTEEPDCNKAVAVCPHGGGTFAAEMSVRFNVMVLLLIAAISGVLVV